MLTLELLQTLSYSHAKYFFLRKRGCSSKGANPCVFFFLLSFFVFFRRDPDRPNEAPPVRMPVVDVGGSQMDVISRLLKDRILLLGQQVRQGYTNKLRIHAPISETLAGGGSCQHQVKQLL